MICCGCHGLLDEEEIYKLAERCGISICDRCAAKVERSYNEWHGGGEAYAPVVKYPRKKISPTVRLRIYERDKFRCKHCGTNEDLTIDHIKPVSRGGDHEDENLQTLCRTCNCRKGVS
ncbi:HNH endonuclease [Citrobacter meridianamericanus]|uniref:HNH endonuclease n=1 Tax=Citrobacter meridianamericanus TaxID=2894201 RepID=UPI003B8A7196